MRALRFGRLPPQRRVGRRRAQISARQVCAERAGHGALQPHRLRRDAERAAAELVLERLLHTEARPFAAAACRHSAHRRVPDLVFGQGARPRRRQRVRGALPHERQERRERARQRRPAQGRAQQVEPPAAAGGGHRAAQHRVQPPAVAGEKARVSPRHRGNGSVSSHRQRGVAHQRAGQPAQDERKSARRRAARRGRQRHAAPLGTRMPGAFRHG